MLSAIGSDWHHLAPVEHGDVAALCEKGYFDSAVKLLHQKVDGVPVFGIKDPRVTKLLPFWKEVFNHCQFNVSYVMVLRHPLSVARSLAKRNGIDCEKNYLLWRGHAIACLLNSSDSKDVLVDYDRLMCTPEHELSRIAEYLDLDVDPVERENYITDFLDQGLRHTVYELKDLLLEDNCPPLVHEVYAALLDIASDKENFYGVKLQKERIQWINEFECDKSYMLLLDRLFAQKAATEQVIAVLESQVANVTANAANALADHAADIVRRDEQLLQIEAELKVALTAVSDITTSRSWRLTLPLRATYQGLRSMLSYIKRCCGK